ncbi:hypothetical protein IW143_002990, partial [Coemansia sp. RSA 520]
MLGTEYVGFLFGLDKLLLVPLALGTIVLYWILVPPKINDGGVPHIPALKTLYWTFKSRPSRMDL